MLQDLDEDQDVVPLPDETFSRTKERSFHCTEQVLPEVYVNFRKSPKLVTTKRIYEGGPEALNMAVLRNTLWMWLRHCSDHIPALGGFISITGTVPKRLTIIGYYPVIFKPITEYGTVEECLRQAKEASDELG